MCARVEPVEVWLITKSLAEFTYHWAKPSIAAMGLMLLFAV